MNQHVIVLAKGYEEGLTKEEITELMKRFDNGISLVPVEFHIENVASYYGFFDYSLGEDGWWKNSVHQWLADILVYSNKPEKLRSFSNEHFIINEYLFEEEVTLVLYKNIPKQFKNKPKEWDGKVCLHNVNDKWFVHSMIDYPINGLIMKDKIAGPFNSHTDAKEFSEEKGLKIVS